MKKSENRVVFYAESDMLAWLKARAAKTDAPVGAIVRRAVRERMEAPAWVGEVEESGSELS